jgi:phage terminase small subunit
MLNPKLKLNQRQETFCLEYFKSGNASNAALVAGYSPKTAQEIASENLTKPMIIARINELRAVPQAKTILSVVQRQELLTKFATEVLENKNGVVRSDNIRAISELNKMDHIYEIMPQVTKEVHQSIIFILPDGTKIPPKLLLEAAKTPIQEP